MLKSFLAIIAASLLVACGSDDKKTSTQPVTPAAPKAVTMADFPNEAGTPFGRWATAPQKDEAQGVTFQYKLYVNRQNQVAMGLDCYTDTQRASGLTLANSKIEGQTLQLLTETAVVAKSDTGLECNVTFNAVTFDWAHFGDNLNLTNRNGGGRIDLSRAE